MGTKVSLKYTRKPVRTLYLDNFSRQLICINIHIFREACSDPAKIRLHIYKNTSFASKLVKLVVTTIYIR